MEDFPAIFKEITQIDDRDLSNAVREVLFQKWVRMDPAGCMVFLETGDYFHRSQALGAWVSYDADAAYHWAQTAGDEAKAAELTRTMFQWLAVADTRKFLTLAATAKERHLPGKAVQAAFRKYARTNPRAAADAVKGLADGTRGDASWGVGVEWARRDPAAALEWAKGLTTAAERQSALRGVLRSWAARDPEAVLPHLALLEDVVQDVKGEHPKQAVIRGLSSTDPIKALHFISENLSDPAERIDQAGTLAISRLAATMRPSELAELMEKAQIARGLGASDPSAPGDGSAVQDPNSDPTMKLVRNDDLYKDLPDPGGAFREMMSGSITPSGKLVAAALAGQWVRKDPEAALAAYASEPEGPSRELLNTALLGRAAAERDLGLLGKIEGGLSAAGRAQADHLIHEITKADPEKVIAWADRLPPESKSVDTARGIAVTVWATYDTKSALAYAEQRPPADQPLLYNAISMAGAMATPTETANGWLPSRRG